MIFNFTLISGCRAQKLSFFVRGKRYTIEGALCIDGLLAFGIQEGPMTSQDYQYFVEAILVCMSIIRYFNNLICVYNITNIMVLASKNECIFGTI